MLAVFGVSGFRVGKGFWTRLLRVLATRLDAQSIFAEVVVVVVFVVVVVVAVKVAQA